MSASFDDRGGRSGKVVPVEVAQQLLEQRDQLVAELQGARRRIDELETEQNSLKSERDELRNEVQSLRGEARQLRGEVAAGAEQLESADGEAVEEHVVERMQERIERLNADLERVRRRTSETVDNARREERVRLLSGLGGVLDAVDRALEMADEEDSWRQGLEGIRNQLMAFLEAEGATTTGAPGEKMDPQIHRAVSTVESDEFDSGHIVHTQRVGLVLEDGTVVRSANVVVAE